MIIMVDGVKLMYVGKSIIFKYVGSVASAKNKHKGLSEFIFLRS